MYLNAQSVIIMIPLSKNAKHAILHVLIVKILQLNVLPVELGICYIYIIIHVRGTVLVVMLKIQILIDAISALMGVPHVLIHPQHAFLAHQVDLNHICINLSAITHAHQE